MQPMQPDHPGRKSGEPGQLILELLLLACAGKYIKWSEEDQGVEKQRLLQ